MAFSKIVGFDVTPVRASSTIIRSNSPVVIRFLRMVSSQIETPAAWSSWSGFIAVPLGE